MDNPTERGRKNVLEELKRAEYLLDEAQNTWKFSLQTSQLVRSTVPPITTTTSAFEAINIVARLVQSADRRINLLNRGGDIFPRLDLSTTIFLSTKQTLSTETKAYHLKRICANAQEYLERLDVLLKVHESKIFLVMDGVRRVVQGLIANEREDPMMLLLRIESRSEEAVESLSLKQQWSYYDLRVSVRRHLAVHDGSRFKLLNVLSDMGIKLPRQRMITDYFLPVYLDVEIDSTVTNNDFTVP